MIRTYVPAVLVMMLAAHLSSLVAAASSNDIRPSASQPNIVLIISDDQAWTDFSFMGHPHIQTPNLDRLAHESLTFTRGYVPSSLCCPSLASIITGLYPHQHMVTSNDPTAPKGVKTAEFRKSAAFQEGREIMNHHLELVPTLPRLLAEAGYVSLQTGKWWQGNFSRGGFTQGMTKGERHGDVGLDIGRKTMQPIYDFIATAERGKKPFFVWYAPMMPHQPHNPPQRILEKYAKRRITHLAIRVFPIGLLLTCSAGCRDALPERVPVSGTVLIDGQPLSLGSIMFIHPSSRPSAGMIDSEGHFTLSCYKPNDGAVIGKHRVKVTACTSLSERSNRWLAPKKYADVNSSGLEVDITEAKNDLQINLTWSGGKPFVEQW